MIGPKRVHQNGATPSQDSVLGFVSNILRDNKFLSPMAGKPSPPPPTHWQSAWLRRGGRRERPRQNRSNKKRTSYLPAGFCRNLERGGLKNQEVIHGRGGVGTTVPRQSSGKEKTQPLAQGFAWHHSCSGLGRMRCRTVFAGMGGKHRGTHLVHAVAFLHLVRQRHTILGSPRCKPFDPLSPIRPSRHKAGLCRASRHHPLTGGASIPDRAPGAVVPPA